MAYYSNEFTLKRTYGDNEANGLMSSEPGTQNEVRLEKAARQAMSEIDSYLRAGGYLLPLEFTEATETEDGDLEGMLQGISDAFTACILSSSDDLSKKKYETQRTEGLAMLERIRLGELKLDLPMTEDSSGASQVAVVSRRRVFRKSLGSVWRTLRDWRYEI